MSKTQQRWGAPEPELVAQGDRDATQRLTNYLQHYQYLPKDKSAESTTLTSAIKQYQKNFNLSETGKYDQSTAKAMEAPRCGMPDPPQGLRLFTVGSTKWSKLDLTWRIDNSCEDLSQEDVRDVLTFAFSKWAAVVPLTFTQVRQGTAADITIGFYRGVHGDGSDFDGKGNVLAHAYYPETGMIHFDEDEKWTKLFLESVAIHEIGHAIGIGHSAQKMAVMYPSANGVTGLTADDIRAAESLYGVFEIVSREGDPGKGIGGYDLNSRMDKAFGFDYDHSGKADHLCFYRPGSGAIWILKNENGNFTPVFRENDPGKGIGGYDLSNTADRAFAFDYEHSGKLDHIVLYRPGGGAIYIVKNDDGNFKPVYNQPARGKGIGGYDLSNVNDRIFAFDYDGSGKLDHLVLYRAGSGAVWILRNDKGTFSPVYRQNANGSGIGGYDLKSTADRIFAFDYNHSGRLDHLALYRPGTGAFWILKNSNGAFSPVYNQPDPGRGIGGFDLKTTADQAIALKKDQIVLYRPGTGAIFSLKNQNGAFSPEFCRIDPGPGVGGYDLLSRDDFAIAFDYNSSGSADHLVFIRPGRGTIWIFRNRYA